MNTIPQITTVANLQRSYRPLINSLKKSGQPLFVVSNGKLDAVILDHDTYVAREKKHRAIEEEYLLSLVVEAKEESRQLKTVILKENQTLLDILDSNAS